VCPGVADGVLVLKDSGGPEGRWVDPVREPADGVLCAAPGCLAVPGMGGLEKCLNLAGIFLEIFWRWRKTAQSRRFSLRLAHFGSWVPAFAGTSGGLSRAWLTLPAKAQTCAPGPPLPHPPWA